MTHLRIAALLSSLLLAACGGADTRYAADTPVPQDRVRTAYPRVELVQVSLPVYAETEEIQRLSAEGAITPTGALWSDEPGRAMTLQLARDLGALTRGIVAPEPWPFRDFPDAKVDVRVEQFLATEAGAFRLAGQFFVAPETDGRDRAERFAIEAPILTPDEPAAIAAARGLAISALAREIAGALR